MWSVKIIGLKPFAQIVIDFVQGVKPVQVQAFGSQGSIEPFDDTILSWFTRLDKSKFYLGSLCPLLEVLTDKFRAIVTADISGLAALVNDFIQYVTQFSCCYTPGGLYPQIFTRAFIDNIDHPYALLLLTDDPLTQKIHGPAFIDVFWRQ